MQLKPLYSRLTFYILPFLEGLRPVLGLSIKHHRFLEDILCVQLSPGFAGIACARLLAYWLSMALRLRN